MDVTTSERSRLHWSADSAKMSPSALRELLWAGCLMAVMSQQLQACYKDPGMIISSSVGATQGEQSVLQIAELFNCHIAERHISP